MKYQRVLGTLNQFVSDIVWPSNLFNIGNNLPEIFNKIFVIDYNLNEEEKGLSATLYLMINEELNIDLPAFLGSQIILGKGAIERLTYFTVTLQITETTYSISLRNLNITFAIDSIILRPVDEDYKVIENKKVELQLLGSITVKENLDTTIYGFDSVDIPNCMIGDSGLIINATNIFFNFDLSNPRVIIDQINLILPDDLVIPPGKILAKNVEISPQGMSATSALDLNLEYRERNNEKKFFYLPTNPGDQEMETTIFGIPGGLKHVDIVIENNQPTTFNLEGQLTIPYFEEPVDVKFNVDNSSCVSVTLMSVGPDPITITKDELLALHLQSITFDCPNQTLILSGGIEPLLFSKEGIQWPRMDVKNLKIDSSGKISIDEAWLDLKDLVNLDLFGFHFELRKIGLGTQDDKMWIDISGGVKLIEQIPLGLDVEGFRLTWPLDLTINTSDSNTVIEKLQKIEIQFAGVEINIATPGVVQIDGLIRFIKETQKVGFAGDMKLAVIPAGFTAEAGLMVGMNFENPPYPFLYVYFGFESAAGIPLAQTGLALKGAIGLIGMNVAPNKTPEQNWFYDWYKGPPAPGVQQTTKWTDQRNAFAIGVGVTISTADGVVKSTSGLLVLAVPGPILIVQGKAMLLNPSGEGEGPLSALAVFDGNEGTVQFNIEAQAELVKDMIDAHGGVEAFFDFNDLTNWHLYLGQDEPEDRRIQANIMDIMTADAYLMLDMVDADTPRMRMGVNAKIGPHIPDLKIQVAPDWEIGINIEASFRVEGNGQVSINPEQFSGEAELEGELTVNAMGIEFGISGYTNVKFEGPAPFHLAGEVGYSLDLPWPAPDYGGKADFEYTIPKVTLEVSDPLQSVSLFSRFTNQSPAATIPAKNENEKTTVESSVVVPVDTNPVLNFEQQMNDEDGMLFLMHPDGIKKYKVGKITLTPTLKSIRIFEKKKSEPWDPGFSPDDSHLIYTALTSVNSKKLRGVWLTESDPQSPSQPASRKLQLFTDSPLVNTAHTYQMEAGLFLSPEVPQQHLSQLLLNDYPDLMFVKPGKPAKVCVNFNVRNDNQQLVPIRINANTIKNFAGLQFKSDNDLYIGYLKYKQEHCYGLYATGKLTIQFPEEIAVCTISYCSIHSPENIYNKTPLKKIKNDRTEIKPSIKYLLSGVKKDDILISEDAGEIGAGKWLQFSGGKYFNKIEMIAGELIIKSICYLTKSDMENYNSSVNIGEDNQAMAENNLGDTIVPYLNPGCYYKMVIETEITGEVFGDLVYLGKGIYQSALDEALAKANASNNTFHFKKAVYFQTDSPPNNLSSYIKWTYPNQELNRVYCHDDFAVCFKRDYLQNIFDGKGDLLKNFKIEAMILDAQNNLQNYQTQWNKEEGFTWDAFTLFPDEYTWEKYKAQRNLPTTKRKEDVLRILRNGSDFLKPGQKYNLLLTGGDGGPVFIPQKLEIDQLNKYWEYDHLKWAYDENKILKLISDGSQYLLSQKDTFENTEVTFEVNSSVDFGIVFRYKKSGGENAKETYFSVLFTKILELPDRPNVIVFEKKEGARSKKSMENYLINEFNNLEWKKFKIKIIGNRVQIFCFNKNLITKDTGFFDLLTLNSSSPESKIDSNIAGKVGLYSYKNSVSFRNFSVRNAELMRIHFYTAGFNAQSEINTVEFKTIGITGSSVDVNTFNSLYKSVALSSFNLYKSSIDLEYGMARYPETSPILFGREAVEKYRQELREFQKQLDDHFNDTALSLTGGDFFAENKKGFIIYTFIKNDTCEAIYLKSPEKLFPKLSDNQIQQSPVLRDLKDPHARTTLQVSVNTRVVETNIMFNSDGDRFLLKMDPIKIESNKQEIKVSFSFISDFNDDHDAVFFEGQGIQHHRYDRPFIFNSDDNNFSITFQI